MDEKEQSEKRDNSPAENAHEIQHRTTMERGESHQHTSEPKCCCRLRYGEFLRKGRPFDQALLDKEFPEFTPIGDELVELIKYWVKQDIDSRFWFFLYGQAGGEWRIRAKANTAYEK